MLKIEKVIIVRNGASLTVTWKRASIFLNAIPASDSFPDSRLLQIPGFPGDWRMETEIVTKTGDTRYLAIY